MKIQNFPDIDLPTVIVSVALPGAAPAQLETEVARKIENSIATRHRASSTSTARIQDGMVTVTAEFRLEKDTAEAVDDVRDAVSRVRADLPQDLREPIVSKLDIAGMPVLTYSIASDADGRGGVVLVRRQRRHAALLAVPGVGKVSRGSAACTARSGWSSIRRGCRRSTSPPPRSRGASARSSRKRRAAGPTSAAPSSRSARSAPSRTAAEIARARDPAARRPARPPRRQVASRHRHRRRAPRRGVARRQAGGRLRDQPQPRRQRGRRRPRAMRSTSCRS